MIDIQYYNKKKKNDDKKKNAESIGCKEICHEVKMIRAHGGRNAIKEFYNELQI